MSLKEVKGNHIVGLISNEERDDNNTVSTIPTPNNLSQPKYAATSPYYDIMLYSFSPTESSPSTLMQAKKMETNRTTIREQLKQAGTSLDINDHDKFGDGDQSPIKDTRSHPFYMELFKKGT